MPRVRTFAKVRMRPEYDVKPLLGEVGRDETDILVARSGSLAGLRRRVIDLDAAQARVGGFPLNAQGSTPAPSMTTCVQRPSISACAWRGTRVSLKF